MIKKVTLIAAAIICLSGLTGCASIVNGTHQSISVQNGQTTGALCSLTNNKGQWFINNTPGSVVVNRSFDDLRISCSKKGYSNAHLRLSSHTKAMAFGNIIFGGAVGAGIDVVDGAAYDYPTNVFIPMHHA